MGLEVDRAFVKKLNGDYPYFKMVNNHQFD